MAGRQVGATVRQLQTLFNVGTACGLTDDQLLARFVSSRDHGAFEALVERHGPMVASVCRGVLKDPNDAQDAFQATFLVLVRKAGSIRGGGSLGSWLYRVAFNMAVRINSEAARRQRLERRAGAMAEPSKTDSTHGDELVPALYEEVDRLPEKYRLPVVLCHLEELSHAQAARQLGWTEGAVRGRVARAREVLRRRLARRGLVLSAGALATAMAERSASASSASVPAAWIDGTVKAATAIVVGQPVAAGAVSVAAISFSETMVRSLFMTRLKIAAAAVLAVGGAVFVAAIAAEQGNGAMRKADSTPRSDVAARAVVAIEKTPRADEKTRPVPVAGRVIDPDGRPVSGAKLYLTEAHDPDKSAPPPIVRATSGTDGRFSFQVSRGEVQRSWRPIANGDHPGVVAIADGFGPGFGIEPDKSGAYTIRLALDDIPVEGRILDIEGRPVVGARIQVVSIIWQPGEDLSAWREALRAGEGAYPLQYRLMKTWSSRRGAELFQAVTTGADGRFQIRGIGRERIAGILIEGPSVRTTMENVVTRRDLTIRVPDFGPGNLSFPLNYYGARFDHVAEPSRPIVGVVRDKDSGKPLAGAVVRSSRAIGNPGRFIRTTTDAEGRFRLTGLETPTKEWPDGEIRGEVIALPPEGQPYLAAAESLIEPAGSKSLTRDFGLKRGIWIKGRVIDKATGKPHLSTIEYFLFTDNPHASEAADFSQGGGHQWTTEDGTFRIVGLPGRGLLCSRAGNGDYRMGVGAERIKAKRMMIDLETIPLVPHSIHVVNSMS